MTIDKIQQLHESRGWFFFSAGARSYFKSRINNEVIEHPSGGWMFCTSEKGPSGERRYTVQHCTTGGDIDTRHGFAFQQFATMRQAKAAMHEAGKRAVTA